jgi:hypothetical protein
MYESGRPEADYFGGSGGQSPAVKINLNFWGTVQDLPGIVMGVHLFPEIL